MDTTIARARDLRKSMTPQEARVWTRLRGIRLQGYHFRRQAPINGYYPDFVCKRFRLVVEIDGSQHGEEPQHSFDQQRDSRLRAEGYRVLRFWNSDVDTDIDGVVDMILVALAEPPEAERPTRFSLRSNHPPRRRGGKGKREEVKKLRTCSRLVS